MLDHAGLGAALRHPDFDAALGLGGQRIGQQLPARHLVRQQDEARHRLVVVELGDEAFQHLVDGKCAIGPGEVGAVAPVLAGAEEEHLHARLPAVLMGGEYVGLLDALGIDGLVGGDVRERPEAIAIFGGLLVVEPVGGLLHQALVHLAHVLAFAAQEAHGLADQHVVVLEADLARARRRAALDLMQQARARAALEYGVRARSQQERPLQHVDGAVDGASRGERPEVFALAVARAAMLDDLRRPVIVRQQNERERFVVPAAARCSAAGSA